MRRAPGGIFLSTGTRSRLTRLRGARARGVLMFVLALVAVALLLTSLIGLHETMGVT